MPKGGHFYFALTPLLFTLPCLASDVITVGYDDTVIARSERILDDHGKLIQLNDTTGTYTFAYNDDDRLIHILYPIGVETLLSYDFDGRITDVRHSDPAGIPSLTYHYEYDSEGRQLLKERSRNGALDTISYAYTPEGYLARVDYSSGDFETYTYDDYGNRLTSETRRGFVDYEYDGDRLIRAGNTYYSYDEQGNLLTRQCNNTLETFTYNERGLLSTHTGEMGQITFTYNSDGERICKSCNRAIKYATLDAKSLGLAPRVRTPVVYDGDFHYYCYTDRIIASAHPDQQYFYLYDYSDGSIGAIIDQNLNYCVLDFESFGIPCKAQSALGFNGEWLDLETGLYYLYNRYYDPETGRFITPDTQDTHPYIYCYNDPVNFIDPLGLWGWGRPGKAGDSIKGWPKPQPAPKPAPKPVKQTPPPKQTPKQAPAPQPKPAPKPLTPPPVTLPSKPNIPNAKDIVLNRGNQTPSNFNPNTPPSSPPISQTKPTPPKPAAPLPKPTVPNAKDLVINHGPPSPSNFNPNNHPTPPPQEITQPQTPKQNKHTLGETAKNICSGLTHEVLDGIAELSSPLPQLCEEGNAFGKAILPQKLTEEKSPHLASPSETHQRLIEQVHQRIDQAFSTTLADNYTPEAKAANDQITYGIMPPPEGLVKGPRAAAKPGQVATLQGNKAAQELGSAEREISRTAGRLQKVGSDVTSDIKFTEHALQRALERNVSRDAILDTLESPLKVEKVKIDHLKRPSQRIIGKKAEVVINPETQQIISVNPTSTKKTEKLMKPPSS